MYCEYCQPGVCDPLKKFSGPGQVHWFYLGSGPGPGLGLDTKYYEKRPKKLHKKENTAKKGKFRVRATAKTPGLDRDGSQTPAVGLGPLSSTESAKPILNFFARCV